MQLKQKKYISPTSFFSKGVKKLTNINLNKLKRSPIEFLQHTSGSKEIRKILQHGPKHNIQNIKPCIKITNDFILVTQKKTQLQP